MKIKTGQIEMAFMNSIEGLDSGDSHYADIAQALKHSRTIAESLNEVLENEGSGPFKFKRDWLIGLLVDRANLKMDEAIGDSLAGSIPVWAMVEAVFGDLVEMNLIKTQMIEDDRAPGEAKK